MVQPGAPVAKTGEGNVVLLTIGFLRQLALAPVINVSLPKILLVFVGHAGAPR